MMRQFRWLGSALIIAGLFSPAMADQNVVVVLDDSGSMAERMQTANGNQRKIQVAKQALAGVLGQLPEGTNVGVLALNSKISGSSWIIPFGTGDANQWRNNINQLNAQGGTPLGEFMKLAADELLKIRETRIYDDYRLLIVTDGEANDGRLVDRYLPDILSRGLMVDVIGVNMQSDHSLATRVHSYRRADDDAALEQALAAVFAETSSASQDLDDDFELLAALPDGFAEGVLEALQKKGNNPISGEDVLLDSRSMSISGGSSGASSIAEGIVGLVCCFGGLMTMVVLVGVLVFAAKPKRRR